MEKVTFVDPQTKESIDFFVVEETQVTVRVIFCHGRGRWRL